MRMTTDITANEPSRVLLGENAEISGTGQLQLNVIFTEPKATALALTKAVALAEDLDACIHIRAALAVPIRLPLDQPHVSIPFMQEMLARLVTSITYNGPQMPEIGIDLYLCRERSEAFLRTLGPNSLVLIAGPQRPWPTAETRMAKRLQAEGHRVLFIPYRGRN
jgi:hypothetical protein